MTKAIILAGLLLAGCHETNQSKIDPWPASVQSLRTDDGHDWLSDDQQVEFDGLPGTRGIANGAGGSYTTDGWQLNMAERT